VFQHWRGSIRKVSGNQCQLRPIWPNYKQQKRFRRSGLNWHPFLVLSRLQMISWQLKNAAECQRTTVKSSAKSQQKQISKRLTQLKNRYLVESFLGFDCKCSKEGPRLRMARLRIGMVKILKSSLGIVRTCNYFHCR
jgi:hypothetical protein